MALPATPILLTLKAPERNLRSGAFARARPGFGRLPHGVISS